jgi:tRNA(Ile)-lysidine synthase
LLNRDNFSLMEKQGDIINKIKKTIWHYSMLAPGDKVIVAVSAGPDSICLLDLLNRLSPEMDLKLIVAHFDHGLRGDEDEFETELSRDMAQSMGLPFETEKASHLYKDIPSLEDQARTARYTFLENVRIKYKAQKIAMGHNLNDQAETVLMRLLRGSGPAGLAGIPPVRDGRIIRPLIDVTREEVMDYIKSNNLPYAVDSSNDSRKHLRNRIRHELIPVMLQYQPRLLERMGTFSNIMRSDDAFLESMALDWIDKDSIKAGDKEISVAVSPLRNLPSALKTRVIRNLIKQIDGSIYPVEYDHVEFVLKLLDNKQPQCSVDLPKGVVVKKRYEMLHFELGELDQLAGHNRTTPHPDPLPQGEREFVGASPQGEMGFNEASRQKEKESIGTSPQRKREFNLSIEGPGTYHLNATGQILILEYINISANLTIERDLSIVYLDADKLNYPLTARNFQPGDRFVPMGMKGHKKVKNFFIDLKIPSEERALTPVLTSGEDIVWICGYRIDERFKVTSQTKKILKITISRK